MEDSFPVDEELADCQNIIRKAGKGDNDEEAFDFRVNLSDSCGWKYRFGEDAADGSGTDGL
ncbi:MAG: hypothetical protein GXO69_09020 [Acidobacteria bacterium]|nr:hypothetical protein [Acidobacteriota bacterium]